VRCTGPSWQTSGVARALDAIADTTEAGTRWCAGLPCVAEERLTELQRTAAERIYGRARNALLGYVIGGTLVLPAALALGLWGLDVGDRRAWVAACVTTFAVLMPLCIAKALDYGRAALPLRRDLEDGFMWVFQGQLAQERYEEEDPEVLALLHDGLFARGEVEQRICVLPRSGRLMQVNERSVPPLRRLHVSTTASWPSPVFRYSLPPEVKEVFGPAAGNLKRRRIGDPERAELSRHVARLTRPPWLFIGLTALTSIFVSSWIVRDRASPADLFALLGAVVWVVSAWRHVRGYALARRLESDLELGWLLSWEASEPPRAAPRPPDSQPPPFQRAEVLPISQRDWTIDGKPAAWRRVLSRSG
jgi:hypothetical protein